MHTEFPLVEGDYRQLCLRAHVGVIASGTASLEAALLGLPHIIGYRADHLTATMMRHLIRTPHVGLPNIVHGARVVPELLQDELTVDRLASRLLSLCQEKRYSECRGRLQRTSELLGGGGAMSRIVDTFRD